MGEKGDEGATGFAPQHRWGQTDGNAREEAGSKAARAGQEEGGGAETGSDVSAS